MDEHDIGLRRLYPVAGAVEARGEPLRVMLEGVERGGGYHPHLAHTTAKRLADTPRLPDGLLVTGEQGPHGSPEALGGADGDRLGVLAPLAGRNTGRDFGVEEPRPVEMHLETQAPRLGGDRGELLQREDLAPGDVVGVLQAKELRAGEMDVLGPYGGPQGLGSHDASLTRDRSHLYAGEEGRCPGLVV